jgi:hypothetical protein
MNNERKRSKYSGTAKLGEQRPPLLWSNHNNQGQRGAAPSWEIEGCQIEAPYHSSQGLKQPETSCPARKLLKMIECSLNMGKFSCSTSSNINSTGSTQIFPRPKPVTSE